MQQNGILNVPEDCTIFSDTFEIPMEFAALQNVSTNDASIYQIFNNNDALWNNLMDSFQLPHTNRTTEQLTRFVQKTLKMDKFDIPLQNFYHAIATTRNEFRPTTAPDTISTATGPSTTIIITIITSIITISIAAIITTLAALVYTRSKARQNPNETEIEETITLN